MMATSAKPASEKMTCRVRRNMGRDYTPARPVAPHASAILVAQWFAAGSKGRFQATTAISQIEGLLSREPDRRPELAEAATLYLAGADLTAGEGPSQATAQAILGRLRDALEGPGLIVTKSLLSDQEINEIRWFRHKVRGLLAAN